MKPQPSGRPTSSQSNRSSIAGVSDWNHASSSAGANFKTSRASPSLRSTDSFELPIQGQTSNSWVQARDRRLSQESTAPSDISSPLEEHRVGPRGRNADKAYRVLGIVPNETSASNASQKQKDPLRQGSGSAGSAMAMPSSSAMDHSRSQRDGMHGFPYALPRAGAAEVVVDEVPVRKGNSFFKYLGTKVRRRSSRHDDQRHL